MMNRRQFLEFLSASAGIAFTSTLNADDRTSTSAKPVYAQPTSPKARVIIVGGGMAGAAVAKYLRMWGDQIDITLIERSVNYTSCILSNLVVTGQRTLAQLQFSYQQLKDRYGIRVVQGDVVGLEAATRTLTLADGTTLTADRIVLAPGVEFDVIPGLETAAAQDRVPHAWKAGAQTLTLRDRLRSLAPGGVVALTIPKAPYRCPPGPYERACILADYLRKNKPGSRLIVLDANAEIVAERTTFTNAFNVTHAGVIEYHNNVAVQSIDATAGVVHTNIGNINAALINAIPPHRAGAIIAASGLNNVDARWAGVNVLTYESSVAPGIHVIGDSSATGQPKAGHIANQEAKVCAQAIADLLAGRAVDQAPMTNSACYSTITMSTASWLTAVFAYDPATASMKLVPGSSGEADRVSKDNFEDMSKWFKSLMADTFA